MKKLLIKSFGLLMLIGFFIVSCNPEEDDRNLTGKLDASEIDFQVIQDFDLDSGGNTIILINNTPETISVWDYGTGKSRKKVDTIRFAFQGDYVIKRTAITEGGQVELEPITITVTDDNLNYVNDPLWTSLSGGVGNSKAWVADNGNYGFAPGALAYADPNTTVEFNDFTPNWEPEGLPPGSTDENMNWGNYMTFSLDGGPFMTVHDGDDNLLETGTYFLDKDAKTLTTNGIFILRPDNYIANASNWNSDLKILTLTENQLRIAIFRTNDEGPWWYVLNYVAKDYADNYVPADQPDPTPPIDLNGGTVTDLIAVTTTTTKTWALSTDTPFNWTDLDGTFLNPWNSIADYPDWTGYSADDQPLVTGSKIIFSSDGTVSTVDNAGTVTEGTYTTDNQTNVISFSGITPTFTLGDSWATVTTTSQNEWKIVKTGLTGGIVTDIWFGKRDESDPPKSEYMVFHFVLEQGTPVEEEPGTEIDFDNSKLVVGDLESNGNLRLELFNEYGSTFSNPPLNRDDFVFGNSVEVTFTLSGITLNPGAVGTYDASIYYADSDWNPQGNGSTIEVTGDGTYTVSFVPTSTANGVIVFVIDVVGLATDITDISAVTANIDSIVIE